MLFGSKAISVRKSINEIKSVVEVFCPIYEYNGFKNSKCFVNLVNLLVNLVLLFNGNFYIIFKN